MYVFEVVVVEVRLAVVVWWRWGGVVTSVFFRRGNGVSRGVGGASGRVVMVIVAMVVYVFDVVCIGSRGSEGRGGRVLVLVVMVFFFDVAVVLGVLVVLEQQQSAASNLHNHNTLTPALTTPPPPPDLNRYSLKKRMIPRAKMIKSVGLGKPIFRQHVKAVAAYTGPRFEKWLDTQVLERDLPPLKRGASAVGS